MDTSQENRKEIDAVVENTETKNIFELFFKENLYFKLKRSLLYKTTIILALFILLNFILPFYIALLITVATNSFIAIILENIRIERETKGSEAKNCIRNKSIIINNQPCTFIFTPLLDNTKKTFSIEANNKSTFRKLIKRIDYTHNNVTSVFYVPEGYSVSIEK